MSVTRLLETSEKMTLKCVGDLVLDTTTFVSAPALHLTATALALEYGGTGATSDSAARAALGLEIGTDVQAYDVQLANIAALTGLTNDQTIIWDNTLNSGAGGFKAGNTTVGAGAIGTTELANNAVTADKIFANSVTNVKMADDAINTDELVNLAVTTGKLAEGAVTASKMAINSVDTAQLINLAVATGKLAEGAVTVSKMASNSVDTAQLVDSSVATGKLAATSVTADKLGNDVTGDGLSGGNGSAITVDSTVVRTTGDQTVAGIKTFSSALTQQNTSESGSTTVTIHEIKTTNATPATLVEFTSASNAVTYYDIKISCCSSDTSDYAAFNLFCVHVVNTTGTTFLVAGENNEIVVRSSGLSASVVDAVGTSATFTVSVTGASLSLRWNARVTRVVTPKWTS
jgi:hypothetical protein